jgi:xanthine/uracil/vitamin C permease (AzgA family)
MDGIPETFRWVVGVGCGLFVGLIVFFNLGILVLSLRGKYAPSYLPVLGLVFGAAALFALPVRPHPAVAFGVLAVLFLSESAGFVRR